MSQCVVGILKEIKPSEGRVAVTPQGVRELITLGALVVVESGAGALSGHSDQDYIAAGASIAMVAQPVWKNSDIVMKVKEPIASEYRYLAYLKGKILFTYLHLAGVDPVLTDRLIENEVIALAYETVSEVVGGRTVFPLLTPMSRIAGEQSMKAALARHQPSDYPILTATIIGCGNVGEASLQVALAAKVGLIAVFESRSERICELNRQYRGNRNLIVLSLSALNSQVGRTILADSDIVISGPMLPGGKEAPIVLTDAHLATMKFGAYISDVSIDQGGSTEQTKGKATKPGTTFTWGANQLVFSSVANIPGSTVPVEATNALTAETLPYVKQLVTHVRSYGTPSDLLPIPQQLFGMCPPLKAGLQTWHGFVTNKHVADKHGRLDRYLDLDTI